MTFEEACSLLDISPDDDLDIEQLERNYIHKLNSVPHKRDRINEACEYLINVYDEVYGVKESGRKEQKLKIWQYIVMLIISIFVTNAIKVHIGTRKDTASRDFLFSYIYQLKRQSDFAAFDYWLGVRIPQSGLTLQQLNEKLLQEAREYSWKISKRPSLGRQAGYYVALKNDIEKLYRAFKEDGIYYQPSFVSGNLDILLRGF